MIHSPGSDPESATSGLELQVEVAGQGYRCRIGGGTEIGPKPVVTPIPRAPHWLAGLTMGRDQVLPVIDLSALLGAGPGAGDRSRMVTLRLPGFGLGFLVDDVRSAGGEGGPGLDLLDLARALGSRLRAELERAPSGD